MTVFLNNFLIALPLFALVGLGYLFASLRLVTPEIGKALSKFAFTVAIPTLLFRLMSNITQLPAPKLGVPFAFFGSCILVYFFGRILAKKLCHLTTDEQTVFGMATVFSNNVQLGVPISIALLPPASMPALAVIFALNAFLLWPFATVQIESSRARSPSLSRTIYQGTMRSLRNPIVIGIILGLLWSLTGLEMPVPLKKTVDPMANAASPVALFAVGVGLTQYKLRSHFETTGLITVLKLGVQPVVVFLLGHLMGLTGPELQAVCLLGCLPVGVNVYIMAQEFNVLQGPTANSLLLTTILAAVTLPAVLSLLGLL